MDFKDLKTKPDEVKKIAKNFKEWYDEQQPKKRCDMIEGHDNYWEGKIEEIKKVIDDTPQYALQKDFEKALNEIKKILDEA
jgi:endonuclease IV